MTPYFADERAVLIRGEALDALRAMPDESVDAVVTDPPAGIGFMNRGWDSDKGGRDLWIAWLAEIFREVLRVLKPGGHALVWALPKTTHWTVTALENAGFETRERVAHFFGSGFPKSLNVSKAIDASLGAEREVTGPGASNCPDLADGRECTCYLTHTGDGFGTALKPAVEDWWLVRKPLGGTVVACVIEYGTGAINIDACRIGTSKDVPSSPRRMVQGQAYGDLANAVGDTSGFDPNVGRFPANLILSHDERCVDVGEAHACVPGCPVREVDAQSGTKPGCRSGSDKSPRKRTTTGAVLAMKQGQLYAESGGASRFFYCPKPPKKETERGCEHLPARTGGEATDREDGSAGLNSPRAGAGRTGGARNHHPTKKSVTLMRYLCRLITPPGGLVLDPFTGSGTTGVAALAEGFSFVGIERDLDDKTGESLGYCEIIKARLIQALIDHAKKETP